MADAGQDYYTGYVYATSDAYQIGDYFDPASQNNETGFNGRYYIESMTANDGGSEGQVFITNYHDSESGFNLSVNGYYDDGGASGFSGLGSEYDYLNGDTSSGDYYLGGDYYEADILPGTIAFDNASYYVNEDGTVVNQSITLVRTGGSDGEVSVTVNLSDGSANSADYVNTPIVVTFANKEFRKTITVPISDDGLSESSETINLTLVNPTAGATFGPQSTAELTVLDNDSSVIMGTENDDLLTVPDAGGRYTVVSKAGDDTIQLDSQIHVITEMPSGGTDTIESSTNYNLAGQNGLENLILTGTENINGVGNSKANRIQGNSGQNRLTGLGGNDTFVFAFGDSSILAPDRIRDFELGTETIDILTEGGIVSLREFSNAGTANPTSVEEGQQILASVFLDADAITPEAQPLAINSGAFMDITTPGIAGRYLLINDGVAGFQDTSDLVIDITNVNTTTVINEPLVFI